MIDDGLDYEKPTPCSTPGIPPATRTTPGRNTHRKKRPAGATPAGFLYLEAMIKHTTKNSIKATVNGMIVFQGKSFPLHSFQKIAIPNATIRKAPMIAASASCSATKQYTAARQLERRPQSK
jgi:hypothetical protein